MKIKLTRAELYDLVWSVPMLTLSKQYEISDVGLRKLCRRMEIPVPKIGYWQKLKRGSQLIKVKLPDNYSGKQDVTLALRDPESPPSTSFKAAIGILIQEILNDPSLPLKVPERLSTNDDLIAAVKIDLTSKRYKPYNGIITSESSNLDISVSPKNLNRALRFMASFIKLLKARGHKVLIEDRTTFAVIEGQYFQLSLREKSSKVEGLQSWQDGYTKPTGVLSLQIKESYRVIEAKDGIVSLEEQLAKTLARIELKGKALKAAQERWQKEREAQEAQAMKEKERRLLEEKELEAFKRLLRRAERWQRTIQLHEYLKRLKTSETEEFLKWATAKCSWYNPLIEAEDRLLQNIDRDTLAQSRLPPLF